MIGFRWWMKLLHGDYGRRLVWGILSVRLLNIKELKVRKRMAWVWRSEESCGEFQLIFRCLPWRWQRMWLMLMCMINLLGAVNQLVLTLQYVSTDIGKVNFLTVIVCPISFWNLITLNKCKSLADDESNNLTLSTNPTTTPVKTTWTLLLYLTSPATGCEGGETVFYPDDVFVPKKNVNQDPVVVSLETGMCLLHRHGNECMLVSKNSFCLFGLSFWTKVCSGHDDL